MAETTATPKALLQKKSAISRVALPAVVVALIIWGLYASSLYNYLLFHSLAELFSIVIASCIFVVAWNARRFMDNNYLLFLGIAYVFIGGIDLLHTLAYTGMPVFKGFGSNLPTQLWIAARYMQSLSLLAAPLFLTRRMRTGAVVGAYAVVTALLLTSIFYWQVFPVCYIDGTGLTPFKKISEYIISAILLGSLFFLFRKRREFDSNVLRLLAVSIIATVGSELFFAFYVSVYGLSNLIGHFLKIAAFYFVYLAIIQTGISRPYDLLFRGLKDSERRLERQARELAEANANLTAVNAELEAFNYSVSHDLQSPLRSIDGFSYIVLNEYGDKLDSRVKEYLQQVRSSAKNMSQLIEALLGLSRVRRREIHPGAVDLSKIVGDAAARFQAQEPGRRVEWQIADGLNARGDPGLLSAALENLVGNAWKYTGKREHARIEFGVMEKEEQPAYFVRDNGVGFNQVDAVKLFTPFARLHSASDFPGTGIGLATVQRIIQRHGGKVWAEGEPDKGATFYFTLPGDVAPPAQPHSD